MISIKGLSKVYGKNMALDNVSMKIEKGSIYGILGCNGAGKTTTICIISGLVRKSSGIVFVDGKDLDSKEDEIKKAIGVMPQNTHLYGNKTAWQNMIFYASLKGMKREAAEKEIELFFQEFQLEAIKHTRIRSLSHGYSKILLIMQAFLNSPKIVLLDEPISGFDPKKVVMIRDFIRRKSKTTTIVISSHNLDEVDRLCTHIAIMHEGKVVLEGKKEKIKKGKSLEKVVLENI